MAEDTASINPIPPHKHKWVPLWAGVDWPNEDGVPVFVVMYRCEDEKCNISTIRTVSNVAGVSL